MAISKRFSRRDHSGQLLPHHHTTYFGLGILLGLIGVVLVACTGIYRTQAATVSQNGNITVAGTVYGLPPTVPAIILNPSSGDTVYDSQIIVSGSCGAGLLVKIFRNNVLAGSTVCTGTGNFNIQVSLVAGNNVLRARNYDFQDQAGPDSPDVVVNLAAPAPPNTNPQSQSGSSVASLNNSLIITSRDSYKTIKPNAELEWSFEIISGQAPYAVLVDWGDGETALLSLRSAGDFKLKHIYRKAGTYRVSVKVTDALGNKAVLEVVAQANGAGALPQITQGPRYYDQILPLLLAWPTYIFISCLVLSFWLGEKYYQRVLFKSLQAKKISPITARPAS